MKPLLVYGASYPDIIKLISAINQAAPAWELIGFLDDVKTTSGERNFVGYPILGGGEVIDHYCGKGAYFFNNVFASAAARSRVTEKMDRHSVKYASLIHPGVELEQVSCGTGVMIMGGVYVGMNSTIGDHAELRANCVVSHDVVLGDNVFIGAGAVVSGRVIVESSAYIGAGAIIKENMRLGEKSVVGAGAVVVRDVPAGVTVVGVPARPLEAKNEK